MVHWWKAHHKTYPLLAKLAKVYLGIPATSVPSERVFSAAEDIVTAQRSALNAENVDKLIFFRKKNPESLRLCKAVRLYVLLVSCQLLTCLKFIQMRCVLIYFQHRTDLDLIEKYRDTYRIVCHVS